MRYWLRIVIGLSWLVVGAAWAQESETPIVVTDARGVEVTISDMSRIIALGGAVTEVLFDLGLGDQIVAVDESSIYPGEVMMLPNIGYLRFLSAEPVLALDPTLIIATEDAGPPEAVRQLELSGVTFVMVPAEDTLDGAVAKIRAIAAAVGRVEAGEAIIATMQADIAEAQALQALVTEAPRVMYVFIRGLAVLTVSGSGTGADEMIRLAGGENAVTEYEGYRPMTAEAVVAAAPDIILATSLGIDSIGGLEEFLELPGVALTPAAQNGRIVYENFDELNLLGFTPRLGEAILDLTYLLHPDIPRSVAVAIRLDAELWSWHLMLDRAGLNTLLEASESGYTVIAPVNAALQQLGGMMPEGFVIEGVYTLEALVEAGSVMTINGESLSVTVDVDGRVLIGEGLVVVGGDVLAVNGIIHRVDLRSQ